MYSWKRVGWRKESWRKAELTGSYQSLTVHNQIKQSVTEKWRNKAGSLTRCFVKFNFKEKTSIPNPVVPYMLKTPTVLLLTTV